MDQIASAQFLTRDTNLRVNSWNSAAGVTLTIVVRRFGPDGSLTVDEFDHVPNTDRTRKQTTHQLAEGRLLSIEAFASAGTPQRGQCFVQLELVLGNTGALRRSATLVQDYVTDQAVAAWPASLLRASTDGPGAVRLVGGTNPAAGVEIVETVPVGAVWRLLAFAYAFVASAAVANRNPILTIDDGATVLYTASSAVIVTAGLTAKYRAAAGVPFFTVDTREYALPLPVGLLLPAGARIRTVTGAIDVGDDYGAPEYLIEEWIRI